MLVSKVCVGREVLEKLEWITDEFTGITGGRCRICGGYKGDRGLHLGEFAGHRPDCELSIALTSEGPATLIEVKITEEFLDWLEDQFTWRREGAKDFAQEFVSMLYATGGLTIVELDETDLAQEREC